MQPSSSPSQAPLKKLLSAATTTTIPMRLPVLPAELLLHTASYLEPHTLLQLSLANRQLAALLLPELSTG